MKDKMDQAPYLDLAPGLNGVSYKQDFVHAPASLFPKEERAPKEKFEGSYAMNISMGK